MNEMNYALNSTEVFGSRIGSGRKSDRKRSALAAWTRRPDVWSSARISEKRCINWNFALGVVGAAVVSAAGWTGIVFAIARLLK